MSKSPPAIFNPALRRARRNRAAPMQAQADFLHQRAMGDVVDRLESVNRHFDNALFYGCGSLTKMLTPACNVGHAIHADLSAAWLPPKAHHTPTLLYEETIQPWGPKQFDLIVSLLTLHHVNDLVGALAQYLQALKPDGLFIAALFGEETLSLLRKNLLVAETTHRNGGAARISPFAHIRDLGATMQRAGFAMPVADLDRVHVQYQEPMRLFADLRAMGETNILARQGPPLTRAILHEWRTLSGDPIEENFDIIYLTGWAPHRDQRPALKPGSAQHSLQEAVTKMIEADQEKSEEQ